MATIRPTNVTRLAGDTVAYTYDNMGELKTAIGKEAGGTTNRLLEQFGYAYDAAGNLNYRTNNALLQQFNVNNLNELTTTTNGRSLTVSGATTSVATNVTVNSLTAALYSDASFAKDGFTIASGNNTFTAIAKDSYGRRATNAVTVNLPATNTYSYDLNGNLLSDGNRNFAYDDENELNSVYVTNAWREDFVYDGKMRRRITKEYTWNGSWLETNEVHYIYDGNLVVQERNANNLPLATYTRGNDLSGSLQGAGGIGGLLARTDNSKLIISDPLATAFYHADGNGNVVYLLYLNQTMAAKYLYDPYGNTLAMSGPLANANTYRFSSKEWNANSGLYYYLYRFYDPNLQRWPNRDPLGELGFQLIPKDPSSASVNEANSFIFVKNCPVCWWDAFGLKLGDGKVHGNYCGGGWCGGEQLKPGEKCNYSVKPTDGMDSCCQTHDQCYEKAGADKKKLDECDKQMCKCLEDYLNSCDTMNRKDMITYGKLHTFACHD
jgi:RHS repeat-associated protein